MAWFTPFTVFDFSTSFSYDITVSFPFSNTLEIKWQQVRHRIYTVYTCAVWDRAQEDAREKRWITKCALETCRNEIQLVRSSRPMPSLFHPAWHQPSNTPCEETHLLVTSFFPFTNVVDVEVLFTAPFPQPPPPMPPPPWPPNELRVENEEKPPWPIAGAPKKLSINCRPPKGLKNCASNELCPFLRLPPLLFPFTPCPLVYMPASGDALAQWVTWRDILCNNYVPPKMSAKGELPKNSLNTSSGSRKVNPNPL